MEGNPPKNIVGTHYRKWCKRYPFLTPDLAPVKRSEEDEEKNGCPSIDDAARAGDSSDSTAQEETERPEDEDTIRIVAFAEETLRDALGTPSSVSMEWFDGWPWDNARGT